MSDDHIVKLAEAKETGRFFFGQRVTYVWNKHGNLVRERWFHRPRWSRLKARLFWWKQPVMQVVSVGDGKVTMRSMRWSWRRWKWVLE